MAAGGRSHAIRPVLPRGLPAAGRFRADAGEFDPTGEVVAVTLSRFDPAVVETRRGRGVAEVR